MGTHQSLVDAVRRAIGLLALGIVLAGGYSATAADAIAGQELAVITAQNAVYIQRIAKIAKSATRIALGPGERELTLLDWDKSVEVVDDANLNTKRMLLDGFKPVYFATSHDGNLLAWTERNSSLYSVHNLAEMSTIKFTAGDSVGGATFSPDGKFVLIGDTVVTAEDGHGGGYSELKLWDTSGKLVRTFDRCRQGALTPVFSPDSKLLAVGSRNYETRIYDFTTGDRFQTLGRNMTQEIAFSPDGKRLACGYVDGTVAIWEVATGKLLVEAPSGCEEVYSVDWSPQGDVLATSGRQGKIVLWSPEKLTKLKELEAPVWVIQVRFSADGNRLFSSGAADTSASTDRAVMIWGVARKQDR
jgi:WD40 repeat protein